MSSYLVFYLCIDKYVYNISFIIFTEWQVVAIICLEEMTKPKEMFCIVTKDIKSVSIPTCEGEGSSHQPTILGTPAWCLWSQRNPGTIYLEMASDSKGKGLSLIRSCSASDISHKLRFFWPTPHKSEISTPPSWVPLICYNDSQNSRKNIYSLGC